MTGTGWAPLVRAADGIERLYRWLCEARGTGAPARAGVADDLATSAALVASSSVAAARGHGGGGLAAR